MALVLMVISYFGSKITGLEMISVFQITFFLLYPLTNLNPQVNALTYIRLSIGFNDIHEV